MNYPSINFNVQSFLATAGRGRKIVRLKPKAKFFLQGSSADSVFFLQQGSAKVTVVSSEGREATLTMLSIGDFFGEESLAFVEGVYTATATAIGECTALKMERSEIRRVIHQEHTFSDLFATHLLTNNMRIQADLVDQLVSSCEKRLARILLLMAEYGQQGTQPILIPAITQGNLADMVGTTRSRVSFFMNRFRKMGFIEYNGRIHVHQSLGVVMLQSNRPKKRQAQLY
jgi:CRP/FNR family transcriptional regulator, cyclic AMP receptor protein